MHFDPETLVIMGAAYDAAMHKLGNPGVKVSTATREAVARRIITVAGAGIIDVRELERLGLEASTFTTPEGGRPCAPVSWDRDLARSSPSRQSRPLRYGSRSRRWRI